MEGRIRILFVVDQIYGPTGGTEQNISFLVHHLPQDRFEVNLVILRNTGYYDQKFFTVEPKFILFKSFTSATQLKDAVSMLVQLIRQRRIDVVHTFFPDSEVLGMLATRMGRRCALIATRRNMGFRHTRVSLWRTRFTNLFIPHFLANSQKVKKYVGRLEWISQKKIEVIYNPLQRDRIEQGLRDSLLKKNFGIYDEERVVGIVANLTPVKDHDTFLHAARLIVDKIPQTKFVIVGESQPEWKRRLEYLVSDLGIGSSVIFAGKHDNPVPFMKMFDVGVLCSKSEGLSNSLIEYAAVGLPTVATDVGGNPEVVIHGKTGFLVPPSSPESLAKHILELLKNENLRKTYGENAKKLVTERFDQDVVISAYEKFYRKIIHCR